MQKIKPPIFRFSIRRKLLLASLSLLILPWLGYQYIQGIESYLRTAQEQQLLDRAAIIASLMDERHDLFREVSFVTAPGNQQTHIFIRPLNSAIQLDGYADDWDNYRDRSVSLGETTQEENFAVSYRLGSWQGFLYLLLQVKDDKVVYRQPNSLKIENSDHLRISFQDPQGDFRRYRLTTIAPGWISAYSMPNNSQSSLPLGSEFRIKGEWQEVPGGYNVELRIPIELIGNHFAFAVVDVDSTEPGNEKHILATSNTEQLKTLGSISIPTIVLSNLLDRLQKPQSRLWVVDSYQRVKGMSGTLSKTELYMENVEPHDFFSGVTRLFYRLILDQPSSEFIDPFSAASFLDNSAIKTALSGVADVVWQQTSDQKVNLITAAHPVYINNQVVGAVAIEETSNSILILQNQAIEALVNMSMLAIIITMGVLLTFATRLSIRVHRLRNEVEASVTAEGRIQSNIKSTRDGDELGDLGRSFAAMHQRLGQYNRYLESMASKLSHELRTPITIVRSSLDNLANNPSATEKTNYLQRANEGVERLSSILSRMSEATHLEQTIQQETKELFSLTEVVSSCVDGYRLAHPEHSFELETPGNNIQINGSAELIAQMLDKLVSNAMDFAKEETPICFSIAQNSNKALISITNHGPTLAEEMRAHLFDSLVSVREGKSDQPHLGLGLYIVRLIAEFHLGHAEVSNLPDRSGVIFTIHLPLP